MAASMRRERQRPLETDATVEVWTPNSRATLASELPPTRSCILICSWRWISSRKALPSYLSTDMGHRVVQN